MSGAMLTWNLKDTKSLEAKLEKMSRVNTSALLESLAEEVEDQTRERFDTKRGPDSPWPEWSETYKISRPGSGGSLLQKEGGLLNSITHNLNGDEVEVGSNLIYAATHQYGDEEKRKIPARPYLGITPENEADLAQIAEDFLERVVDG